MPLRIARISAACAGRPVLAQGGSGVLIPGRHDGARRLNISLLSTFSRFLFSQNRSHLVDLVSP